MSAVSSSISIPLPHTEAVQRSEPPAHLSSGYLRWATRMVALLWWLCLLAAVLFALAWGALHGLIVPRIDQLRPTLESRLTQTLGVPVRIGAIAAQSQALAFSLQLQDVRLLDSTGRDALVLKKVMAGLSPRSLMQLSFEQLVIEQPELDVRRDAQGHFFVAGLDMSANAADDQNGSAAADWFFSQREFVIRSGTVRWTDELRGAPPLALNQVDLVLRNPGRHHLFRLDATPVAGWGDRFTLVGQVRSPLLGTPAGQWREWDGQLYADFSRIDVSGLKRYADVGVDITRGVGAVRAWATLERGHISAATADIALNGVDVRLAKSLQPIALRSVKGRLTGQELSGGIRMAAQGLSFSTQDGVVWPEGNLSFMQTGQQGQAKGSGDFAADKLDLAMLAQIADRLPLGTPTHHLLQSLAPKGVVLSAQAAWQGHISAPANYEAKGRVQGLSLAAQRAAPGASGNRPGLRGATVDFKLNQAGGDAKLSVARGALDLPGFFEDPVVPLDSLSADAKWTLYGQQIDLKLTNLKFSNADVEGLAQAHWHTADPAKSQGKSRYPGVLDLQGSLSRADGTRVYRYMPLFMHKPTRDYVHASVLKGRISAAKFTVKGDLFDMPFANPALGEFRIAAQIEDAHYAYAPRASQSAGALPWPALTQISGELVYDRTSLAVNGATGRIGEKGSVQILRADARIADLTGQSSATSVIVQADTQGALADVLAIVNGSPLLEITDKSLAKASVTGNAQVKLRLQLPLGELENTKVAGSLTLAGNDVQITPETPVLAQSKGVVSFSESGFALNDVQTRILGGEARLEGGSRSNAGPDEAGLVFKAQGNISAESLRQAKELGFASRLGQHASGSAAYAATLGFRRGVAELSITSNLQGMGLNLPAPLAKSAEATLPLRYENTLVRASLAAGQKMQDQILVDLGSIASIAYVRDVSGKEPRVLRGGIGVGLSQGETASTTDDRVVANINFTQVDLDAWQKVLSAAAASSFAPAGAGSADSQAGGGYLPSIIAVRARELRLDGRTLHNVVVGGSREGLTWRANLDARELNGYGEYRQPSGNNPGRVYARLARLTIEPTAAKEIEVALSEQPTAVPALDIVVEDMELRGKKLGRVEVEAVNRGAQAIAREGGVREWRLNKLNITVPEAQFSATGNWAALGATTGRGASQSRRTVMNFKLDIADSGELLKRLGMDKVLNKGKGKMEGQVAWMGSPLALDYPSLGGSFNVNIESGQFLKADPGIAKLLGVLSLQTLPRRLALDFRDVFSDGFSFDFIRGDVKIEQGIAFTNNLQMKGVNAGVLMEGRADIAKETQDLRVVVVPEINAGTASLVAAVINPAIGLGTFLAQLLLRRPFIEAATQEFRVEGSWADPKVTKVDRRSAPANNQNSAPNAGTQ